MRARINIRRYARCNNIIIVYGRANISVYAVCADGREGEGEVERMFYDCTRKTGCPSVWKRSAFEFTNSPPSPPFPVSFRGRRLLIQNSVSHPTRDLRVRRGKNPPFCTDYCLRLTRGVGVQTSPKNTTLFTRWNAPETSRPDSKRSSGRRLVH